MIILTDYINLNKNNYLTNINNLIKLYYTNMSLFKFNEYLTEERNLQQYDSKIEDIREVIYLLNT